MSYIIKVFWLGSVHYRWDRGFEPRSRHGCLLATFSVVLSCVGRGLATRPTSLTCVSEAGSVYVFRWEGTILTLWGPLNKDNHHWALSLGLSNGSQRVGAFPPEDGDRTNLRNLVNFRILIIYFYIGVILNNKLNHAQPKYNFFEYTVVKK
jgi:hypothetical protein